MIRDPNVERLTDDVEWNFIGPLAPTTSRWAQTLTYRTAEIYHVRDGKISARWAFSDDTEAINRFFA
jgi:ketosteroid isomerase-like protein